jgi:hypothetical protein
MFIALTFGLCAMVVEHSTPPVVAIGYIEEKACNFRLMLGMGGTTPPLEIRPGSSDKHQFRVLIEQRTATLWLDGFEYDIPRGEAL